MVISRSMLSETVDAAERNVDSVAAFRLLAERVWNGQQALADAIERLSLTLQGHVPPAAVLMAQRRRRGMKGATKATTSATKISKTAKNGNTARQMSGPPTRRKASAPSTTTTPIQKRSQGKPRR